MGRIPPEIAFEQMKYSHVDWESDPAAVWYFDSEGVLCERVTNLFLPGEVLHYPAFVRPPRNPSDPLPDSFVPRKLGADTLGFSPKVDCSCGKSYSRRIAVDACIMRGHRVISRA